jgi:uncharacterized protein YqjF (DUF2071 family)
MEPLAFTPEMLRRPTPSGIDAVTTLRHFAIVTWAVPPERLRSLVPPRFELDCVEIGGTPRALLSAVPFEDQDFRAAAFPSPRWRFGQTNYRLYVRDRRTSRRAVWFLGTTLGSVAVALPRLAWRLPWHYGRFLIDCRQDASGRYLCYRVTTRSRWAPAHLELAHEPDALTRFPGFPDAETALVVLTHPLEGYYTRLDGRLGTYSVWHEPLAPGAGRVVAARFGLLDRLGLVSFAEQAETHSVLIQPRTEFLVRLPPRACAAGE